MKSALERLKREYDLDLLLGRLLRIGAHWICFGLSREQIKHICKLHKGRYVHHLISVCIQNT